MGISREIVTLMKEDEPRTRVLIPLFKAMGFRDVYHNHGSAQEKGKDIVMWMPEGIRERVNYAVVVKAGKISGKASGSSSAGEILPQITQCFDAPYADPITTQEQHVDRCWVVTSKTIKKEAIAAIKRTFHKTNLDKVTDFIDGEKQWGWVEKYFLQAAQEKVREAQQIFNELDPDGRVVVRTHGGIPEYSVEPKHQNARNLEVSVRARFPKTPEGQKAAEEVERALKTGAPMKLEGKYLEEFKFPPFLEPIFGLWEGVEGVLTSVPHRVPHSLLAKITVENDDRERRVLDSLDVDTVQAGTEEVTLDNDHQPEPWKIRVVLQSAEKRLNFQYHMSLVGTNVQQALAALCFQAAVAKPGVFKL